MKKRRNGIVGLWRNPYFGAVLVCVLVATAARSTFGAEEPLPDEEAMVRIDGSVTSEAVYDTNVFQTKFLLCQY